MKNRTLKIALAIISIIVVGAAAISYWICFGTFSSHTEHTYLYIDKDDNIDSVYTKIEEAGAPQQMLGFKLLSNILGYDEAVKTGKYEIGNHLTTIDIIRNLRNKHQVPVRLTIPNVRTMSRLSYKLAKSIEPDSAELMQCFTDSAFCEKYHSTPATISCLFLPNTYEVYWDITPEQLATKMEKESMKFWSKERRAKADSLEMTLTEVMTLASIVDQETANNAEKPKIAGMYLNRLKKGMLLQADPTVKFALQQFSLRRILHEHLKFDSPYNTYIYKGLPPGPISIPALSSIEAVLNADPNDYLFMCAKEDFSGTHNFASTYSEHLKNARKYTRALNARGIK